MEALAGIAIVAGMVLAFMAGTAVQALRQAVQNLRKTEESISGLKETVASSRWRSVGRLLFALAFAVLVLAVAIAR